MNTIIDSIKKNNWVKLTIFLFFLLTVWWILINIGGTTNAFVNNLFGFVYGGFSIYGGIWGLIISKLWGGRKSLIGKAIISLSIGLLLQAFGQYSFWFYNIFFKISVPYPGIPDIGFFGTIPFYIYGGILLAKSSGVKISLSSLNNRILAFAIPAVMLSIGWWLFLKNYEFDWTQPLKILFDFGYPLGQAIYISIALLTYSLSLKTLGGYMRNPIIILIMAFTMQFFADYSFIYFQEVFYPASAIDFIYLTSYFVMTLGFFQFRLTALKLKNQI